MPDQEFRDVTKKMVSGFGDQVRYTFMSLEPMAGLSAAIRGSPCSRWDKMKLPREFGE